LEDSEYFSCVKAQESIDSVNLVVENLDNHRIGEIAKEIGKGREFEASNSQLEPGIFDKVKAICQHLDSVSNLDYAQNM